MLEAQRMPERAFGRTHWNISSPTGSNSTYAIGQACNFTILEKWASCIRMKHHTLKPKALESCQKGLQAYAEKRNTQYPLDLHGSTAL